MIPFTSLENFYEECTTGIEFEYDHKWYLIEFDDPFHGVGTVRIHLQDEDGKVYFDGCRSEEFLNLEDLVHNYKISERTLAEIICDENSISREVLPVKRHLETWQAEGNEVILELHRNGIDKAPVSQRACYIKQKISAIENTPIVKTEYIPTSQGFPHKIISYGEPNFPEFWTFLFDEKDSIHKTYILPEEYHHLNLGESDNIMRYCYTAKYPQKDSPKYIIKDVINEQIVEWAEIFSDNDPTSLWAKEVK